MNESLTNEPSGWTDQKFVVSTPITGGYQTVRKKQEWWVEYGLDNSLFKGKAYFMMKRAMDLLILFFALPVLLPLMGLVALLIKLESQGAPVVFTQCRTGKGGRRFKIYKFRTMVPNAEEMKLQLLHLNELQWPDFKISQDPRVTRIGHILRKTSLDELPQVFNILKGEMTIVGPRPTSFGADTYQLWHTERLDITPGLTGLWQVIGRGEMEFDERVRLDVAYAKHRCLTLDFIIMFLTFATVLKGKGAY
jgi:lipopolysaccharide/colanic/teichoic acid biosynthesis glycosyltransferase